MSITFRFSEFYGATMPQFDEFHHVVAYRGLLIHYAKEARNREEDPNLIGYIQWLINDANAVLKRDYQYDVDGKHPRVHASLFEHYLDTVAYENRELSRLRQKVFGADPPGLARAGRKPRVLEEED